MATAMARGPGRFASIPFAMGRPIISNPNPAVLTGRILLCLLAWALAASAALSQVGYGMQRIEGPPEAYSMVATGMNDLGHVVGWSQFFDGGPSLRAWVWTPETGVTYLPQPPGLGTWAATDITRTA